MAEDIRAALASLGRGDHAVGGVALVGPRPLPPAKAVDAVVLTPRGVIVIIGVDLPDPAIRLEAPLSGTWKADGWPLIGPDNAVNPGTGALTVAESVGRQLREKVSPSLRIGTILAVGPFVENVEQPAVDLSGSVRVLHPTPTSMLAATVSLASAEEPCTVEQVRALLTMLAPDAARLSSEVLTAEGFAEEPAEPEEDPFSAVTVALPASPRAPKPLPAKPAAPEPAASAISVALEAAPRPQAEPVLQQQVRPQPVAEQEQATKPVPHPKAAPQPPAKQQTTAHQTAQTATQQPPNPQPVLQPLPQQPYQPPVPPIPPIPPSPPLPKPIEVTSPVPRVRIPIRPEGKPKTVRWLPMAAIGLLAVIVVAAIVLATTSGSDSTDSAHSTNSAGAPAASAPAPVAQLVQGLQFLPHAMASDQACAQHAYGDVQASLQQAPCATMRRASFETSVDGRPVAVSIAVVYFGDETTATAFQNTADTPGGGGMNDLASETGKWPRPVSFAGAAYASALTGTAVRLVQAVWFDGTSSPSDPALAQVAHSALNVQLS
ncbi:MAG TPA: hypothetical protein VFG87_22865 [Amycolatopsis sp.]|nr:hypothetical protein [Amycolatopsis sp.]